MSWHENYLGLPFIDQGRGLNGCDCWGLVTLIYARELGLTLPSYAEGYSSAEEHAEIAGLIGDAAASPVWLAVAEPRAFDLVTFRRGGYASHIGIVIKPGWMLHMPQAGSRAESYARPYWRSRLNGFYRHKEQL